MVRETGVASHLSIADPSFPLRPPKVCPGPPFSLTQAPRVSCLFLSIADIAEAFVCTLSAHNLTQSKARLTLTAPHSEPVRQKRHKDHSQQQCWRAAACAGTEPHAG